MQECSCLLSAFIFIILLARYRVVCYTLARRHPYFIRIESLFPGMKTDFRRKREIKGVAIPGFSSRSGRPVKLNAFQNMRLERMVPYLSRIEGPPPKRNAARSNRAGIVTRKV